MTDVMDDKTFIASYVAKESQRINERLKEMVEAGQPPSEEEREAVVADIEKTLRRMHAALSTINPDELELDATEEDMQ
jgi:hypothetical protein